MTAAAPSRVFFLPLPADSAELPTAPDLSTGLPELIRQAGGHLAGGRWGLKVHLGRPGLPAAIQPRWAGDVATALQARDDSFVGDTLSISVAGLDQAHGQHAVARDKGYVRPADGLPWRVADGPDQGSGIRLGPEDLNPAGQLRLAAGFAAVDGWAVLNPVRPHPHAGFRGVLTALGVGLVDRNSKIHLHRPIRPQVDTPLCAGCGSCLAVCLFDAIDMQAGRAVINHEKCTGCGACMTVCHMAGISPQEAASVPRFQAKVAQACAGLLATGAAGQAGKVLYANFLMRVDVHLMGARKNGHNHAGQIGVLAGTDPVAVDQAAWDLLSDRMGGSLAAWSGFLQDPEALLDKALALGLGQRAYDLVEIS